MDDDLIIPLDQFSTKPRVFEGVFSVAELERLEDAVANGEGEVRYRVIAALDKQRRKVVSCIIEGFVFLTCQSSLETFRHGISLEDRLVLVDSESELPPIEEEDDTEDYLVADEPLDIRDLIEDAILLSLPMVPRKPGLEAAGIAAGEQAARRESPFAALASLKKTK